MIELIELTLNDGKDIFDMIKEIGPGENGFGNSGYEMNYEDFSEYLIKNIKMSKGIDLWPEQVPQTMYWLYVDGVPGGIGKLRDYLNDNLKKIGGHIGYTIRPSEREKGYGNAILKEVLKRAKEKNITEVFFTCNEDNIPSRKVIEANNGELEDILEGKCRYSIRNLINHKNLELDIDYKDIKVFKSEELGELFLSVNWSSGKYPENLRIAMENSHTVFSAWDGDKLVGLINSLSDGIMTAYFHYLLIRPEYQDQGIGENLVNSMLEKYKDYSRKVLISYDREIGFYEYCGFKIGEGSTPMVITFLKT